MRRYEVRFTLRRGLLDNDATSEALAFVNDEEFARAVGRALKASEEFRHVPVVQLRDAEEVIG